MQLAELLWFQVAVHLRAPIIGNLSRRRPSQDVLRRIQTKLLALRLRPRMGQAAEVLVLVPPHHRRRCHAVISSDRDP